jgi:hypothetical protein
MRREEYESLKEKRRISKIKIEERNNEERHVQSISGLCSI